MATLSVLKFPTSDGAEAARTTVEDLTGQQLVKPHDAAIVPWPEGKRHPKTKQLRDLPRSGALTQQAYRER